MGKRDQRRRSKKLFAEANRVQLLELGEQHRIEIRRFNEIHYRIFGKTIIDYWPSTGRGWEVSSYHAARKMTPLEAFFIALTDEVRLPEGAQEHLKSIIAEPSKV